MKAIVYTSNTCPNCVKVKEYLHGIDVEIEERNISQLKFKKDLMKMGYMGVPLVIINEVEIYGFNQQAIDEALNK